MANLENKAEQIGNHILSEIGETITSIEPAYGSMYLETISGKTYSISIMECEE